MHRLHLPCNIESSIAMAMCVYVYGSYSQCHHICTKMVTMTANVIDGPKRENFILKIVLPRNYDERNKLLKSRTVRLV